MLVQIGGKTFIQTTHITHTASVRDFDYNTDEEKFGIRVFFVGGDDREFYGAACDKIVAALNAEAAAHVPDLTDTSIQLVEKPIQTPSPQRCENWHQLNRQFWGSVHNNGLNPNDRDSRIKGINQYFDWNVASITELSENQFLKLIEAVEHGCFPENWVLETRKVA